MPSLFTAALWIVLEDAIERAELRPIDLVWTALCLPFGWALVASVFAVTP